MKIKFGEDCRLVMFASKEGRQKLIALVRMHNACSDFKKMKTTIQNKSKQTKSNLFTLYVEQDL